MHKRIKAFIVLASVLLPAILTVSARAILEEAAKEPHIPESQPGSISILSEIDPLPEPVAVPVSAPPAKPAPPAEPSAPVFEPAPVVPSAPAAVPGLPSRLSIPSIALSAPVLPVGLTPSGEMDVLDSATHVGWYKLGPVPGRAGSAVMDAHVYQQFSNLKNVKLGDRIYVDGKNGSRSSFVVTDIEVYEYTDARPLQRIFNLNDKARLNLITCYGELTADRSTYTHRLVVYAELAD